MKRAILVIAALAALACSGSGDEEANEQILQSLPKLPDAQLLSVDTQPYYDCRHLILRRRLGYTTTVTYRAPLQTTADEVVEFYIDGLNQDWEYRRDEIGVRTVATPPVPMEAGGSPDPASPEAQAPVGVLGSIPVVHFERGTATVYVFTQDMALLELAGNSPSEHLPDPGPNHDFSVHIDAQGTVERPYCD